MTCTTENDRIRFETRRVFRLDSSILPRDKGKYIADIEKRVIDERVRFIFIREIFQSRRINNAEKTYKASRNAKTVLNRVTGSCFINAR